MTNTQKLCKECEFFHIKYEPIKDVDFGQAECKKHNLVADFASHRLLNRLRCVEKGEQMDDLISRQAAIDALNEVVKDHSITDFDAIASILDLPSAQPEIIRCKDCKYRGVGNYCVYGTRLAWITKSNDFCSRAERRTDE